MKLNKFYPADRQPGTLTGALVQAGHYASPQSARAVLMRAGVENITLDLSGTWTDPETGEQVRVVVRGVVVERTPGKYLEPEKNESNGKE